MNYYHKEFLKVQEEFHEVMHDFPLFLETIRDIEERDIKEINELLEKNDEFYLKKAISKLEDLIKFIKDTSESIDKEYKTFDKLARIWEKVIINDVSEQELRSINDKVKEANSLIKSHDIKDLKKANSIMEKLIHDNK